MLVPKQSRDQRRRHRGEDHGGGDGGGQEPEEVRRQRGGEPVGVAGRGRQSRQGDLAGGVGEHQRCHQDLAGKIVVAGGRRTQDQTDHEQVGGQLRLIGEGDQRQGPGSGPAPDRPHG